MHSFLSTKGGKSDMQIAQCAPRVHHVLLSSIALAKDEVNIQVASEASGSERARGAPGRGRVVGRCFSRGGGRAEAVRIHESTGRGPLLDGIKDAAALASAGELVGARSSAAHTRGVGAGAGAGLEGSHAGALDGRAQEESRKQHDEELSHHHHLLLRLFGLVGVRSGSLVCLRLRATGSAEFLRKGISRYSLTCLKRALNLDKSRSGATM